MDKMKEFFEKTLPEAMHKLEVEVALPQQSMPPLQSQPHSNNTTPDKATAAPAGLFEPLKPIELAAPRESTDNNTHNSNNPADEVQTDATTDAGMSQTHHDAASANAAALLAQGQITQEEHDQILSKLRALNHDAGRDQMVQTAQRATMEAEELTASGVLSAEELQEIMRKQEV